MIVVAKTAAKSAARLAAKQAAKIGVKLIFKTIGAALKSFAKLAAGPVGWALMVFDMFSMTLDIIDISGYEKMQTTQMFVLQRETIKKELNKYLNELAKENEAQGHGRNVNYPAIRGPLDKLSEKEFNFELEKFEEEIYESKLNEILSEELESLKESNSIDLINIYLSRKYGVNNPYEYKFMKLFKLDWDLLEDHERNDFVELDGLNH